MQFASVVECSHPSSVMSQAVSHFRSISGYTDSCLNRQLADRNGSLTVSEWCIHQWLSEQASEYKSCRQAELCCHRNIHLGLHSQVLEWRPFSYISYTQCSKNQCFIKKGFFLNDFPEEILCSDCGWLALLSYLRGGRVALVKRSWLRSCKTCKKSDWREMGATTHHSPLIIAQELRITSWNV